MLEHPQAENIMWLTGADEETGVGATNTIISIRQNKSSQSIFDDLISYVMNYITKLFKVYIFSYTSHLYGIFDLTC